MPFSQDASANQIQERLKSLQGLIHEIDNDRRRNEPPIKNVTEMLEKLHRGDRSSAHQNKLRHSLKLRLDETKHEEDLIRDALNKIQEIRVIRNGRRMQQRNAGNKETIRRTALMKYLQISAQTLPLYISRPGDAKVPPLCGAIPAESSYIAKAGDMVAAFSKSSSGEYNWILAEVVSFNASQNKYEVDDIDEEQKDRHVLPKRCVVPLPLMKANPETDHIALFSKNALVMALYPQTTCFYKAVINSLPCASTDEYKVFFEDASYSEGFSPEMGVQQKYVFSHKLSKKSF